MLKGINRQVLEVAHPECAYFERVLFIVRPEYSSVSESRLKGKADELIRNSSTPPRKKSSAGVRKKIPQAIRIAAAAAAGAAVSGVFSVLVK